MQNLPAKVLSTQEEDARFLIALAREVAAGIHDLDTILKNHSITKEQYDELVKNPFYSRVLQAEIASWNAAGNAPERIKIEAAATLENWLPTLHARLQNLDESLPGVVEGGKLLAKLSGMDTKDAKVGSSEKYVINIDIGTGNNVKLEVEKTIDVVSEVVDVVGPQEQRSTREANTPKTIEAAPERQGTISKMDKEQPGKEEKI